MLTKNLYILMIIFHHAKSINTMKPTIAINFDLVAVPPFPFVVVVVDGEVQVP